ncbi:hypothetical protein BD770DRAFT_449935 [Pilaira anomala]|nr:hypothetical protein BD770DRAFT_449935 [Pilaira anomala]
MRRSIASVDPSQAQDSSTSLDSMRGSFNIYDGEVIECLWKNRNFHGKRVIDKVLLVNTDGSTKKPTIKRQSMPATYSYLTKTLGKETDNEDLENRYDMTYQTTKTFVKAQIIPQSNVMYKWSIIEKNEANLLALMLEDYFDTVIGNDNSFPLFAFCNSWGAKSLLGTAIRNTAGRTLEAIASDFVLTPAVNISERKAELKNPKKNEKDTVSRDEEVIEEKEGDDEEEEEQVDENDTEVVDNDDEQCESLSDIEIAVKTREIAVLKKREASTALKIKKNGSSAKKSATKKKLTPSTLKNI